MVFVIESSSSIGISNFNLIKNYLSDVVEQYTIGSTDTHVGVVRYSTDPSTVVMLGADSDTASLQLSIGSIPYVPGSVSTASAINHAVQELNMNGRSGVPKIVILLTASESDDIVATASAATETRSQGIQLFVVGVGGEVNEQELNSIVADSDHLFRTTDFMMDSIGAVSNSLVSRTCTGK